MVYHVFIHHMSCDRRPLMATHSGTDTQHRVMVDPYATPIPCPKDECCANWYRKPISESKACPIHPCCVLKEKVLQCKDHDDARNPLPHLNHRCNAIVKYHIYRQDFTRKLYPQPKEEGEGEGDASSASSSSASGRSTTTRSPRSSISSGNSNGSSNGGGFFFQEWEEVKVLDDEKEMLGRRYAPDPESLGFILARRDFFEAGRDLYTAKQEWLTRSIEDLRATTSPAATLEEMAWAREAYNQAQMRVMLCRRFWLRFAELVDYEVKLGGGVIRDRFFEDVKHESMQRLYLQARMDSRRIW